MHQVILYFDNMIDEIFSFETVGEAKKEYERLKQFYQSRRLYRVELTEA